MRKRMDLASGFCGVVSSATLLPVSSGDTSEAGGPAGVATLVTPWVVGRVAGPSMAPTVRSGDRLLVRRVATGDTVGEDAVVLARFPARPELLVVKRVRRAVPGGHWVEGDNPLDRKSTRLNSSHANISYAVFCLKKNNIIPLRSDSAIVYVVA